MKNNPWFYFSMIILLSMAGCSAMFFGTAMKLGEMEQKTVSVKEDSILSLELTGVIMDDKENKRFFRDLNKYAKEDKIKGIIIKVNSPGGAVGTSQRVLSELNRIKETYKKPIYMAADDLMASGAFYAAMGATKVYANPGTLVGSIGVIMQFSDLTQLFEWAKMKPFNIKTGKFKDTGNVSRSMRDDEKQYLQSLVNETLEQFKDAIKEGRQADPDVVDQHADGRVFTGSYAKKIGFIDEVGSWQDALMALSEELNLGKDPKVFTPDRTSEDFMLWLTDSMKGSNPLHSFKKDLGINLLGRPLYIMPHVVGE